MDQQQAIPRHKWCRLVLPDLQVSEHCSSMMSPLPSPSSVLQTLTPSSCNCQAASVKSPSQVTFFRASQAVDSQGCPSSSLRYSTSLKSVQEGVVSCQSCQGLNLPAQDSVKTAFFSTLPSPRTAPSPRARRAVFSFSIASPQTLQAQPPAVRIPMGTSDCTPATDCNAGGYGAARTSSTCQQRRSLDSRPASQGGEQCKVQSPEQQVSRVQLSRTATASSTASGRQPECSWQTMPVLREPTGRRASSRASGIPSCSVCLKTVVGQSCMHFPCGHVVHFQCLPSVLKRGTESSVEEISKLLCPDAAHLMEDGEELRPPSSRAASHQLPGCRDASYDLRLPAISSQGSNSCSGGRVGGLRCAEMGLGSSWHPRPQVGEGSPQEAQPCLHGASVQGQANKFATTLPVRVGERLASGSLRGADQVTKRLQEYFALFGKH